MKKLDEDIYNMIIEEKEELKDIIKQETYLKRIHCNGCNNQCKLSNPQCGRGMMLRKRFEEIKNN